VTIKIRCDNCKKGMKAPDAAAGMTVKCPRCGAGIPIPAAGAAGNGENEADDSPHKIGEVTATKKAGNRCWYCYVEVSPGDIDCPECGAALKAVKRRKPPIVGKKKRKKRKAKAEEEDDWRESLFGAFAYAFPAVLRGKGWQCCLWCTGVMAAAPIVPAFVGLFLICIPFIGPILYLCMMFVLISAAPAGILSRNMEIASRYGVREQMQHWEMSLTGEMIPSSIELLKANLILGVLPLMIAGFFAVAFGGFTTTFSLESVQIVGQIGGLLTGLLYAGVALACSFCGPMCIMLLGVYDVANAIYPPNVFRVLVRTFPQYLAFYFYIVLLVVATYIVAAILAAIVLLVFGSVAAVWDSSGGFTIALAILAVLASLCVVCVVATYFAAVVGWSMGVFIHRNYEHFEAVRE
jgi:hypothetical protein